MGFRSGPRHGPGVVRECPIEHGLLNAVDGEDVGAVVQVAVGVVDVRASGPDLSRSWWVVDLTQARVSP